MNDSYQIAMLASLIAASKDRQAQALDRLRTMKDRLEELSKKSNKAIEQK